MSFSDPLDIPGTTLMKGVTADESLVYLRVGGDMWYDGGERPAVMALNEGGCSHTLVDLLDILNWAKEHHLLVANLRNYPLK